MKIFGYAKDKVDTNLIELKEVTLVASSAELKSVADFLLRCATEMEEDIKWEHEHLSDSESRFEDAELVVFANRN